jgi:hypothetical protein
MPVCLSSTPLCIIDLTDGTDLSRPILYAYPIALFDRPIWGMRIFIFPQN